MIQPNAHRAVVVRGHRPVHGRTPCNPRSAECPALSLWHVRRRGRGCGLASNLNQSELSAVLAKWRRGGAQAISSQPCPGRVSVALYSRVPAVPSRVLSRSRLSRVPAPCPVPRCPVASRPSRIPAPCPGRVPAVSRSCPGRVPAVSQLRVPVVSQPCPGRGVPVAPQPCPGRVPIARGGAAARSLLQRY